jgi:hypothetical protein
MKDNLRYIVGGAAFGALLGAVGGWLYGRILAPSAEDSSLSIRARSLDRGQVVQLAWSVVRVVREILELG